MTNILLSQQKFYCSKHAFVVTKDVFVTTKLFLLQKLHLWQLLQMIVSSISSIAGWSFMAFPFVQHSLLLLPGQIPTLDVIEEQSN